MSHVTTLKGVVIRDVAAMRQAVRDLKAQGVSCDLLENAKPRMYYKHQETPHDFVLRIPNSKYDLAFAKQDDGTYAPAFDEWAGEVKGQIGATCPMPDTREGKVQHQIGQFMQRYAVNAAKNEAAAQGYVVEGEMPADENGDIQLLLAVNQ